MCGHERSAEEGDAPAEAEAAVVTRDAVGNPLADGDDVAAKVPGAGQMYLKSSVVKKA